MPRGVKATASVDEELEALNEPEPDTIPIQLEWSDGGANRKGMLVQIPRETMGGKFRFTTLYNNEIQVEWIEKRQ
ncbi:hypothetical protein CN1A_17 [Clavibacter phage CN1A]|uniref:Uncharacterized protein n=1 Tax=Clavibacter phage CN1A TaxID=1406793 RepID=U5PTQ0_9CAUD|nr:hypothetical protein CN1A_17 [Clavibacter phage CN1A]AGY47126.1 hypothetical protein CN1A_17 [Clavibacter phage CN1A]